MASCSAYSASGNTCETSPASYASRAVSRSESSASRIAFARPTEAATVAVAPPSGIRPILVKARVSAADSVATTRSHASALDIPTPAAMPLRPQTTGLSSSTIARMSMFAPSTEPAS